MHSTSTGGAAVGTLRDQVRVPRRRWLRKRSDARAARCLRRPATRNSESVFAAQPGQGAAAASAGLEPEQIHDASPVPSATASCAARRGSGQVPRRRGSCCPCAAAWRRRSAAPQAIEPVLERGVLTFHQAVRAAATLPGWPTRAESRSAPSTVAIAQRQSAQRLRSATRGHCPASGRGPRRTPHGLCRQSLAAAQAPTP